MGAWTPARRATGGNGGSDMATESNADAPAYVLTVDGRDITRAVDARLIDLQLDEGRGDEADQLSITLDDSDGKLSIPPRGATIALRLGWAGEQLVDKGEFEVDEVEHSGAPDQIRITARAAEMRGPIRQRREHSWHETTLGVVMGAIASRNGLRLRIGPELSSIPVPHLDQTNESDMHLASRLARQHDATATVKKGRLVVLAIGSSTTANGAEIESVRITRDVGDQHRWHTAERGSYTAVRATWHDTRTGTKRDVTAGSGDNAKRLKDTYASEADALAAARAELGRIDRGKATFEITFAYGRAYLMPQTRVTVSGFKPEIDGESWRIVKAGHTVGDGGFTTRVELEVAGQSPG